jgi:hypothetical protein
MRSALPLLIILALAGIAVAWFLSFGFSIWVALLLGIPAVALFMWVMDYVTALPVRMRNKKVYETVCPKCANKLGEASRWRISHPEYNVECASCGAVCTFHARGNLFLPK